MYFVYFKKKTEQICEKLKKTCENEENLVKTTMKTGESSNLFCGHRALGYVSNHVPLVSRYVR